MGDDRKQPGVAFWTTVTVVIVLVGYPLSFVALVAIELYVVKLPAFLHPALKFIYAPCIWLVGRFLPN